MDAQKRCIAPFQLALFQAVLFCGRLLWGRNGDCYFKPSLCRRTHLKHDCWRRRVTALEWQLSLFHYIPFEGCIAQNLQNRTHFRWCQYLFPIDPFPFCLFLNSPTWKNSGIYLMEIYDFKIKILPFLNEW